MEIKSLQLSQYLQPNYDMIRIQYLFESRKTSQIQKFKKTMQDFKHIQNLQSQRKKNIQIITNSLGKTQKSLIFTRFHLAKSLECKKQMMKQQYNKQMKENQQKIKQKSIEKYKKLLSKSVSSQKRKNKSVQKQKLLIQQNKSYKEKIKHRIKQSRQKNKESSIQKYQLIKKSQTVAKQIKKYVENITKQRMKANHNEIRNENKIQINFYENALKKSYINPQETPGKRTKYFNFFRQ